jgi:hypothetical protein
MLRIAACDGGKQARSPRRARRKPLKPLRREGRTAPAVSVVTNSYAHLILHARLRVQRAPGFPCALVFGVKVACITRTFCAARLRSYAFCCLKIESTISVVPAKRKREPGPITTNLCDAQREATARSAIGICGYGSPRVQGRQWNGQRQSPATP